MTILRPALPKVPCSNAIDLTRAEDIAAFANDLARHERPPAEPMEFVVVGRRYLRRMP
ncbi:hypothetical protein HYPGJ_30700 [Hyphomicrobium sp. GJ21]|nr:hypothetical protein HYPGJ_30700 [Hyphomicrobium sp. GJ21]